MSYGTSRSSGGGIPVGGTGGGGAMSTAIELWGALQNSNPPATPEDLNKIKAAAAAAGLKWDDDRALSKWQEAQASDNKLIFGAALDLQGRQLTAGAQITAAQITAAAGKSSDALRSASAERIAALQNQVQREATASRQQADAAALAENSRQFNLNIEEQRRQFAEKMGFDQKKFEELTRQFDLTTSEGTRQFNERLALDKGKLIEDQRQFDQQISLGRANAILQAPRGPADYFAYAARLPALQRGGYLGDFLSKAIEASTGQRIGQLAAQPVVTNTQLATGLVGAGAGRPMEPAVAQYLSRSLGVGGQAMGQPQTQVVPGSVQPLGAAQPVPQATGFQSSAQEFGRLDPTLQKLYLSLQSEGVPGQVAPGQTAEDFLSGLVRAAPNFGRSQVARLG